MLQKIKNIIKNNSFLGLLFIFALSILYFLISLLLKKKKVILFSSFSGRQYSDSPKVLYEQIKSDSRFDDYKLIWAFNSPKDFPEIKDSVNINSFRFLMILLSSKVWISNASIEKLVPFKPKGTYYVNTWHGVPLKMLGPDEKSIALPIKLWYKHVKFDLFTSTSKYDFDLFQSIFPKIKHNLMVGLPRNYPISILKVHHRELKEKFCKENNLEKDVRLVLYMPTFREFTPTKKNELLTNDVLNKIGKDTYLLVRAHYFENIKLENKKVINVSNEDLNQLMTLSDCLITDYSSVLFDYYYTEKPMYLYCYDLDEYIDYRGLYVNLIDSKKAYNIQGGELERVLTQEVEEFDVRDVITNFSMVENINIQEVVDTIYKNL